MNPETTPSCCKALIRSMTHVKQKTANTRKKEQDKKKSFYIRSFISWKDFHGPSHHNHTQLHYISGTLSVLDSFEIRLYFLLIHNPKRFYSIGSGVQPWNSKLAKQLRLWNECHSVVLMTVIESATLFHVITHSAPSVYYLKIEKNITHA